MNATILAERTSKALTTIEAETRRLGGRLIIPSRGDTAHRHLFMLEAVADALAGIPGPAAEDGTPSEDGPIVIVGDKPGSDEPVEVEAVEAVITVVAEQGVPKEADVAVSPKPKGKGK